MKVVILAGGLGTRFRKKTEFKPKPMINIGNFPILIHIIKFYLVQGHKEFIICGGYKVNQIKDYFINLYSNTNDIEISYGSKTEINILTSKINDFKIKIIDTGANSPTGERILKVKKYLGDEQFLCTYGDGLSNIDLNELINFHNNSKSIATLSSVKQPSRFGILSLEGNKVQKFEEKPISASWINAGYFVFNPEIFSYLEYEQMLEDTTLKKLAEKGQLSSFRHQGFWHPMDTYRDWSLLEELWNSGSAPWKIW